MILSLGYVGVRAPELDTWRGYGPGMLGMQTVDRGGDSIALRMDDRAQRLIVHAEDGRMLAYTGWEVADADALQRIAAHLEANGVAVSAGSRGLADQRHVADLIHCEDPFGNRVELFHAPAQADSTFVPGRTISGFRTGALGMGHAVLLVPDVQKGLSFYRDILGFTVSDYAETPFEAYFLHVNQRHHSLALIHNPDVLDMHHLMIELCQFDDIGQGYDLAIRDGSVGVTLGRHINDHVTGFYTRTPSGFLVEYGWGGKLVETGQTSGAKFDCGYSFWGHERDWLGPEARAEALRLRLEAAGNGMQAPLDVFEGNYRPMPSTCPWWDATVGVKA